MAYKCLSCTRPPEYCDVCTDYAKPRKYQYDERICVLARQGRTDEEIMQITGLSRSTICKARLRHGIEYRKAKKPPDDVLRELFDAQMPTKIIAEQFGVSRNVIYVWKHQLGYRKTDKYDYWRELYNQGLNDVQIALEAGVNKATIWQWRQREGLPAQKRRR